MVENICDIVLTNTIGHLLLGESFHAKTLNQQDYRQITAALENYSLDELEQIIKILIGNLVKQYYQNALPLQEYLEPVSYTHLCRSMSKSTTVWPGTRPDGCTF